MGFLNPNYPLPGESGGILDIYEIHSAMVPKLIKYFLIRSILLNQPQSKVGQSCANNKESDLMGGLNLGPSKHNQIRKQMLQPLCYDSLFKKDVSEF